MNHISVAPEVIAQLRLARERIDDLDATSTADEHTDTGDAWDVLNFAREALNQVVPPPPQELAIGQWREHPSDGTVYRLRVVQEYVRLDDTGRCIPRRLSLECCAEFQPASKALKPHPLDRHVIDEQYIVEVDNSAFSDFDDLCAFAREIGALLHTDPATIIRAI